MAAPPFVDQQGAVANSLHWLQLKLQRIALVATEAPVFFLHGGKPGIQLLYTIVLFTCTS